MQNTVLFDGNCNLCISIAAFLRRRDVHNKLRLVALQSEEGRRLVLKAGLPEKETNTVIYFTGEKFCMRSTAVLNILKDLSGVWKIFYVFIIIPVSVRDYIYKFIARNRYRFFGSKEQCNC
jgi:predicted DCC family thiol-disulfide oxidoreductase YuxK